MEVGNCKEKSVSNDYYFDYITEYKKDVLYDKTLKNVECTSKEGRVEVLQMRVVAYTLNYGPYIGYYVSTSIPFYIGVPCLHPFKFFDKADSKDGGYTISNVGTILPDNSMVREMLLNLASDDEILSTRFGSCHLTGIRCRIIYALSLFWD